MAVDIILGLQWGDEGKGKVVDVFSGEYDWVCRFQGGPNAGHTIVIEGQQFILHQIPSGIFHPGVRCLIGNGVVLNPITLQEELQQLRQAGIRAEERLVLSSRAHLILPSHRQLDQAYETAKGKQKIGSTLRGIGPCYQDKYARQGLRVGDLFRADFEERLQALLQSHQRTLDWLASGLDAEYDLEAFREAVAAMRQLQVTEGEIELGRALERGQSVLVEGAQGTLLDVDFGAYPYVTSSNTIAGGACTGLGIAPQHIREVTGVFKAYTTRVGNGPFPTELQGEMADRLRHQGDEFGATTGRPRRCGWLDLPALRYSALLNGVTRLAVTKVDVLAGFEHIQLCTHYERNGERLDYLPADHEPGELTPVFQTFAGWPAITDAAAPLPPALTAFLDYIETALQVPVAYVSLGPSRKQLHHRQAALAD
jgi:adenylosuccinate synthase